MGTQSSFSDAVQGGFNGHGRPRVSALIRLPRLGVMSNISFILDTGADITMISHRDALEMGVKPKMLKKPSLVTGVGGELRLFAEQAQAAFESGNGKIYVYNQKLHISDKTGPSQSLLGRDIIDRWKILYHPGEGVLQAVELDADKILNGSPTAISLSVPGRN